MIAAVVQVSKLVWKLKTLRLNHSPTIIKDTRQPKPATKGKKMHKFWLSLATLEDRNIRTIIL
jgi:hypothetical protein